MSVIGFVFQAGLVMAFIAAVVVATQKHQRQTRQAWAHVANRLGLSLSYRGGLRTLPQMSGVVNGVGVSLYQERVQSGKNSTIRTILALRGDPPLPGGVNVAIERMGHGMARTLGVVDDVEIGHAEFDDRYLIDAGDAEAMAVLGGPSRFAAAELLESGAKMEHGRIEIHLTRGTRDAAYMEQLIVASAARVEALSAPLRLPPAERLADNARVDPIAGVRLRNLEMLLRRHRSTDAARRAAQHALWDSDPRIVTLAAMHVGSEAAETLAALVRDTSRARDARTAALIALSRVASDHPELPRLASDAWHQASTQVRVAGLIAAASLGGPVRARLGVSGWIEVAARSPDESLQVAAAQAAALAGDGTVEQALCDLLEARGVVRDEAIAALARVGSLAAVQHLLPLTKGLLRAADERRAAEAAVAAIQARCGRGEVGALAVVAGAGGELAVSAEDAGRARIDDEHEVAAAAAQAERRR